MNIRRVLYQCEEEAASVAAVFSVCPFSAGADAGLVHFSRSRSTTGVRP